MVSSSSICRSAGLHVPYKQLPLGARWAPTDKLVAGAGEQGVSWQAAGRAVSWLRLLFRSRAREVVENRQIDHFQLGVPSHRLASPRHVMSCHKLFRRCLAKACLSLYLLQ
jgi:hypothetical protein